jgi:hypothetical protein
MDKQKLIDALVKVDASRPRSLQTAIGVSQLGGCRRQVWHKIQGHEETNPTLRLPAILGTAIHAAIESAIVEPDALIEHRVEVEGFPPATIDYFNPSTGEVVDWKTITLKNVPYFVSQQKRWQVQTYAFLLTQQGHEVDTVTLVGIPRDGTENDIVVHSEPYDEQVALEALAWLEDVKNMKEAPSPQREPVSFCQKYCGFYGDLCQGMSKDISGDPIVDPEVSSAASRYVELSAEIRRLEAEKDATKIVLEGQQGVTIDGIRIGWSEISGRQSPDMDAIKLALGEVPMKQGASSMRLTVK